MSLFEKKKRNKLNCDTLELVCVANPNILQSKQTCIMIN